MVDLTRRFVSGAALSLFAGASFGALAQEAGIAAPPKTPGDWRTYGADLTSSHYSPLAQVKADNFNQLQIAWRFKTDNLGPTADRNLQATPLVVDGRMYLTAGTRRAAVALDARTGELLWKYSLDEGARAANSPRAGSGRGLSYWSDGQDERICYVTIGYQLVCLDARTGLPVKGFGEGGVLDLKKGLDQDIGVETARIGLNATPLVVGDMIVVGSAFDAGYGPNKRNIKGAVVAYDIRTGKRLWIFHTIPAPGEVGYDTWLDGSAEWTGNTGVWAQMSADPDLGLVYVGVELPTGDWYGGNRHGDGLFGESVVALDLKTGQRRWHYQTIHHGVWDRDISSAPILCDLTVKGRRIRALAQPSKQAWLYVLDRVTGKPVWPIPERKVEIGDVPGERYSPTQPFPTRPPAYDRQGISNDDLIDFTPELHAEAVEFVKNYKMGGVFTPLVVSKWPRPIATLMVPYALGGSNWPGGSFDPETNILYIYSQTNIWAQAVGPLDPKVSDAGYGSAMVRDPDKKGPSRLGVMEIQGLPLIKPPWGRVTAIDLNRGEIVWQVPHGETPDKVRNSPLLKGMTIPRTGSGGMLGTLNTKSLVIVGDAQATTGPDGLLSGWLRAYDKATGHEVGQVRMPAAQTGSPMTYEVGGAQYIAVAASGAASPGEIVAYRLP